MGRTLVKDSCRLSNWHPRLMEEHEVRSLNGLVQVGREYGRCGDDGKREVVKNGRP